MAKAGKIKVSITADTDGLRRGTRQAEQDLDRFGKRGASAMNALKLGAVGAGAAIGTGLVAGLGAATKAAVEAEKAQARFDAQMRASGVSLERHGAQIEQVIQKHSQLAAIDDEEVQDAFTNLVRATGDVDKSMKLVGLSTDLARAKNISAAKAAELIGKVSNGNVGVLRRYGVTVAEGATATEALESAQRQFAGQAAKYGDTAAGGMQRAKNAVENLGEAIGARTAPIIGRAANSLSSFITDLGRGQGEGGRFAQGLKGSAAGVTQAWDSVRRFFGDIFAGARPELDKLRGAVGGLVGPVRSTVADIKQTWREAFNGGGGIGESIKTIITQLVRFQAAVQAYIVVPILRRALPGVKQAVQGLITTIGGLVRIVAGVLSGDWRKAWDGARDTVRGVVKALGGIIRAGTAPVRAAASAIAGAFSSALSRGWDRAVDTARNFVNTLIGILNKIPGVNIGKISSGTRSEPNPYPNGRIAPSPPVQFRATGGKVTAPTVVMGEEAPTHPEWVIATNPAYRKKNVAHWMQAGRDLGVMGTGGVLGAARDVAKDALGAVGGLAGRLPGNPFTGVFRGVGSFALGAVRRWLLGQGDGGGGGWVRPTGGPVTSLFGPRKSPGGIGSTNHGGIDLGVPIGTPVKAARSGRVLSAGVVGGYGNYMVLDHGGGWGSGYGHLSRFVAGAGDRVRGGQVIALSGNTGNSTGPHLHFEILRNGQRINPASVLRFARGGVRGGKYLSTAYGPPWDAMNGTGVTKTGVNLRNAPKRYGIAVDPSMIPLGSRVKVSPNPFGYSGAFEAFDTGGAIKGNRIDFYDWRGRVAQMGWGRRTVTVTPAGSPSASGAGGGGRLGVSRGAVSGSVGGLGAVNVIGSGTVSGGLGRFQGESTLSDPVDPVTLARGMEDQRYKAELALAGLTPDKADDIAAQVARQAVVKARLEQAQATSDSVGIEQFATELKSLNDSLKELTAASEDQVALMREQLDLAEQQRKDAVNRANVAEGQTDVIKRWFAEMVSGQLGQRVGAGLGTPSYAGGLARL